MHIWLWKDKDVGIRITLMEMSLMLGKMKTVGKTKIRIGLINLSPVHFHPSSPDRHPLSQKTFVGLHILVSKHLNCILLLASVFSLFLFFSLFVFFLTLNIIIHSFRTHVPNRPNFMCVETSSIQKINMLFALVVA